MWFAKGDFMVQWTDVELQIIRNAEGKSYKTVLNEIPEDKKKWKCHTCYTILKNSELIDKKCPICGEPQLIQMCPLDHNGCGHDVVSSILICPVCAQPVCPVCGDHSVVAITRVTGYLQDLSGFNAAKKQEVRDRVRTNNIEAVFG